MIRVSGWERTPADCQPQYPTAQYPLFRWLSCPICHFWKALRPILRKQAPTDSLACANSGSFQNAEARSRLIFSNCSNLCMETSSSSRPAPWMNCARCCGFYYSFEPFFAAECETAISAPWFSSLFARNWNFCELFAWRKTAADLSGRWCARGRHRSEGWLGDFGFILVGMCLREGGWGWAACPESNPQPHPLSSTYPTICAPIQTQ